MNCRALAVTVMVVALLTGCAPAYPVDGTATHPPKPAAAPTEAAAPVAPAEPVAEAVATFTQPATCPDLAGPELATVFASRSIVLFNSPTGDGLYPGTPVNSHQQGGNPFGCLWGVPDSDLSSFVLSSQPLSYQAHEGVASILDSGGYVTTVDGDVVTYTYVGDETGQPTGEITIHVLRPDSWITGWGALGGETARTRLTEYLDAVAEHLYN